MSIAQTTLSQFENKTPETPNPHDSIGQPCGMLGAMRCWTANGQAENLFEQIENDIKQLLIDNVNAIEECQDAQEAVGWSMYMIGSNAGDATPTLLIDCLDK